MSETPTGRSSLTVREGLAERAVRVKGLLDWARTRLDRAAALAAFAGEPTRPVGEPDILQAANVLCLAESAADDVYAALEEYRDALTLPDLLGLVEQAFDREMAAETDAEVDAWEPDAVANLPVAELAARLSRTAGATV